MVRIENDLLLASDKELVSVLVFLDLSAAIDTIDTVKIIFATALF